MKDFSWTFGGETCVHIIHSKIQYTEHQPCARHFVRQSNYALTCLHKQSIPTITYAYHNDLGLSKCFRNICATDTVFYFPILPWFWNFISFVALTLSRCFWGRDDYPLCVSTCVCVLSFHLSQSMCMRVSHKHTQRTCHTFECTMLKQKWLFMPFPLMHTCAHAFDDIATTWSVVTYVLEQFLGFWATLLLVLLSFYRPGIQEWSVFHLLRNDCALCCQCILPVLLILVSASVIISLFCSSSSSVSVSTQ